MVIANATTLQVANAAPVTDTVGVMGGDPVDPAVRTWRAARLKELLDHPDFAGNKAELGRALGYDSGAYVRQLLAMERPITEKLMARIHQMKGGRFRGWFDERPPPEPAGWPLAPYITQAEWAALSDALRHAAALGAAEGLRRARELIPLSEKRRVSGK